MKKVSFLLFLFLSIAGCKENPAAEEKPIAVEAETKTGPDAECMKKIEKASKILPPECAENDFIREFLCLDGEGRVKWLKENGHKICDGNLYECIQAFHVIKDEETFNTMARGNQNNPTKITWGTIESVIKGVKCYEKYLGFDISGDDIKLKLVDDFTTEETCYSIPFLKGVQSKHKLDKDDKISFVKAIIPVTMGGATKDQQKIIFKIQKGTTNFYFYDLSDFPGTLPFYVPCGI